MKPRVIHRASPAGFGLALALAAAVPAAAHHPGSHARRDGEAVVLDVSHLATLSCARIAAVREGVPAGAAAPKGSLGVTVTITREGPSCEPGVRRLDARARLPAAGTTRLHLFFEMDGKLTATERVEVR